METSIVAEKDFYDTTSHDDVSDESQEEASAKETVKKKSIESFYFKLVLPIALVVLAICLAGVAIIALTSHSGLGTLERQLKENADAHESFMTYTRWGHNACPDEAQAVYTGRVGGTAHTHQGGASNLLCLPEDPQYLQIYNGAQGHSYMYGSRYGQSSTQDNVPCAVCSVTTRQQVLMIPAKYTCPSGWTREYHGYLMSEHMSNYRSTFICVDSDQVSIPGNQANSSATNLYHVEADCANLPCGPYSDEKELTCAVCTK